MTPKIVDEINLCFGGMAGGPDWTNFRLWGEFSIVGIFFFGQILKSEVAQWPSVFGLYSSSETIFCKNGLGYISGDFITNSSGHPGPGQPVSATASMHQL
jgi:hypothetical protein